MSTGYALDFGTASTRLADSTGLIFEEPTLAAMTVDSGELVAFGDEAVGLGAANMSRVRIVRPVRAGQLVDLDLAREVLAEAMKRSGISRGPRRSIVVCSHAHASGTQKRAMERALKKAGAGRVSFVEGLLATAIALGLPFDEPVGQMIIDVGAGVSDCAVIALGGIVSARSIPVGGMSFDDALRQYLAREHSLLVEDALLEVLRDHGGSIARQAPSQHVQVIGRDVLSGRAVRRSVPIAELGAVLRRACMPVITSALACLRESPPDLANDLLRSGVVLTGGGSRLEGFDRLLARALGVPVHVSAEVGRLAVLGAAKLEGPVDELEPVLTRR
jgi:rod shape-determining protein MreB